MSRSHWLVFHKIYVAQKRELIDVVYLAYVAVSTYNDRLRPIIEPNPHLLTEVAEILIEF